MNFFRSIYWVTIVFLVLLSAGCSEEKNIVGSYHLVKSTVAIASQDDFEQSILDASIEKSAEVITLFDDKHYSIIDNANGYSEGVWIYTPKLKSIVFSPDFIDDDKKVGMIDLSKEPFSITVEDTKANEKFIYRRIPFKDSLNENHPFYRTNNQWRLKAKRAETDEEITKRLAAYIKHLALVLKSASANKSDIISFEFSMGPVAVYSGGIGAIPFENIRPSWVKVFYDENDARKAYRFYQSAIANSRTNSASTGHWVEDDYDLLLAIYGNLMKP